MEVARRTSIAPIWLSVDSDKSNENVIAGPKDVKKIKNVLDNTFIVPASVQSDKYTFDRVLKSSRTPRKNELVDMVVITTLI